MHKKNLNNWKEALMFGRKGSVWNVKKEVSTVRQENLCVEPFSGGLSLKSKGWWRCMVGSEPDMLMGRLWPAEGFLVVMHGSAAQLPLNKCDPRASGGTKGPDFV